MVWNVYAENYASSIQVLTTSSSQSLPQTAVCQPKPPAWSLAPTQVEKGWAAPFLHSQSSQPTKMVWGCTKEGVSVPHCVSLRRNYPCHQKTEKRLCNGYCQVPLTCYPQKSTPWHDSKSIFLCMMKHSGAICSQCVACVSGCRSIWETCCTFLNVTSLQMLPSA